MNDLGSKNTNIPSYEAHRYAMQLASMCDEEERVKTYYLAVDLLRETEEGLRGKTTKADNALIEGYKSLIDVVNVSECLLEELSRNKEVQLCGRGSLSRKIEYFNQHKGRMAKSEDLKNLLRNNCSAEAWVQRVPYYTALFSKKNFTGRKRPTLTSFVDDVKDKGTRVQREIDRKRSYEDKWEA